MKKIISCVLFCGEFLIESILLIASFVSHACLLSICMLVLAVLSVGLLLAVRVRASCASSVWLVQRNPEAHWIKWIKLVHFVNCWLNRQGVSQLPFNVHYGKLRVLFLEYWYQQHLCVPVWLLWFAFFPPWDAMSYFLGLGFSECWAQVFEEIPDVQTATSVHSRFSLRDSFQMGFSYFLHGLYTKSTGKASNSLYFYNFIFRSS